MREVTDGKGQLPLSPGWAIGRGSVTSTVSREQWGCGMGFINLFLVLIGIDHKLNVGYGPLLPKKGERCPNHSWIINIWEVNYCFKFIVTPYKTQTKSQVHINNFSEVSVNNPSPLLQSHSYTPLHHHR